MHSLNNRGVDTENLRIFPNCAPNKMDYRQTMIVPTSQKLKHEEEEDDDEDLEALRLAALKSLGAKHTLHGTQQPTLLLQQVKARVGYPSCTVYNHQRQTKRGYYPNRLPRQNGNTYYPSRVNQNLIEIIPVEEDETLDKDLPIQADSRIQKFNVQEDANMKGDSKFYRYKDNASGSEEEDTKESNCPTMASMLKSDRLERVRGDETKSGPEKENQDIIGEKNPREHDDINEDDHYEVTIQEEGEQEKEMVEIEAEKEDDDDADDDEEEKEEEEEEDEDDEEKATNDDDDDVLLMADLEEEDSLERLMDEMEREMNVDKHQGRKEEKKLSKKEGKESKKMSSDVGKVRYRKSRMELDTEKNGVDPVSCGPVKSGSSSLSLIPLRKERRSSVSPRPVDRTLKKRTSLSPKPRPRKKSPRRSPSRRSSPKIANKSFRDVPRARSPRKFSPLSRLSPRPSTTITNHNRSSPLRKLSPRAASPSAPPPPPPPPPPTHSRSPRVRRSRSPRRYSRSRSPKRSNRSTSPRQIVKSRSPQHRASPIRIARLSPRTTTTTMTTMTTTRRSISPRSSSPLRRSSPRPMRSPKLSSPAERQRLTSPSSANRLGSPVRSPWSSPRNSPRLSPRRRKSPKESRSKKPMRVRSISPENASAPISSSYKRQVSPLCKIATSPDIVRPSKEKQKEPIVTLSGNGNGSRLKESIHVGKDPILEARRRKFLSTKLIDPVHDNKKIKLGKKDNSGGSSSSSSSSSSNGSTSSISSTNISEQLQQSDSSKSTRKTSESIKQDHDMPESSDLCPTDDYVYDVSENVASDASSGTNKVSMSIEMVPVKVEKERTRKKKKRDKEIYQVGKLKGGELPLSERLGKEKKCKKRKERATASPIEASSEEQASSTLQDLSVDEEADLRTELSRRRAERLNRAVPIQSARLLQSAFKGVVNEVAKTNAKAIQRYATKGEDKNNKKEVRRVTVLQRAITDMPDSEDEPMVDSKVPIRFRLGINKPPPPLEANSERKTARKSSKRPGRKVKHKK